VALIVRHEQLLRRPGRDGGKPCEQPTQQEQQPKCLKCQAGDTRCVCVERANLLPVRRTQTGEPSA
jgi:hypothetical protein